MKQLRMNFWRKLSESNKQAVMLLWLDAKDVSSISALADAPHKPRMVFLSSTLLGEEMYIISPTRYEKRLI